VRIGILGSGLMGGKLGTIFARAGHDVIFSYSRSRQTLERLAREAGGNARAGTPREAARDADVLLLAVHWSRVDDVLQQAGDVSGRVIVTCSLPMNEDDTDVTRFPQTRAWEERCNPRGYWASPTLFSSARKRRSPYRGRNAGSTPR
jgi:predicted dinucleotide-binding enzyme